MTVPFPHIDALVFDAYGTLLDFNSAALQAKDVLGDRATHLSEIWRAKQLQYTWLRSLMGTYAPFSQVTAEALDHSMETMGIADDTALRTRLLDLYRKLSPFPEVMATLSALRAAGLKMAILTNGSQELIDATCAHAGITPLLDAILSVDDVGIYKPHPSVYALACRRLGIEERGRIAFVSSNGWDAAGAAHFGFRVIWCNRYGQREERLPARPHVGIRSLDEIPALLGIGIGAS